MKHRKLFTTIMLATTVFSLTGCGAKITQTNDELSAELGSELEVNISDFFTANKPEILSDFLVDTTAVKMNEVGTYNVAVAYKNERYNISVNVQDTTAPIITLKENLEGIDSKEISAIDLVEIADKSDCKVYFVKGNEEKEAIEFDSKTYDYELVAVDKGGNRSKAITKSEALSLILNTYKSLTPVTNVDRGDASGNVIDTDTGNGHLGVNNNTQDIFDEEDYNIFNHISENMTYDRKTKEYTITQELLVAIYDLVPQLSEYPKAYQDKILCSIASNKSIYDNAEEIQERIDSGLSEYWRYEDEYGPVGTQGGNTSTGNQQSSDGQQQGGNTSTGGQQSSGGNTSTGGQQSGGYTESYTYITTTEDYKAADGSVYKNTGEVDPARGSIFEDEYGSKWCINTQGGISPVFNELDDFEVDENGANFTDHIRN